VNSDHAKDDYCGTKHQATRVEGHLNGPSETRSLRHNTSILLLGLPNILPLDRSAMEYLPDGPLAFSRGEGGAPQRGNGVGKKKAVEPRKGQTQMSEADKETVSEREMALPPCECLIDFTLWVYRGALCLSFARSIKSFFLCSLCQRSPALRVRFCFYHHAAACIMLFSHSRLRVTGAGAGQGKARGVSG
jgi:hypothetical protein